MANNLMQLKAWSYSRFADYERCPLKCKFKHVDRLREPDNDATRRGSMVHKLAEQFTKGQLRAYPKELGAKFKARFAELRKLKALCEQEWAFDKLWKVVGWFDASTWLRIKMDVHYIKQQKAGKVMKTTVSAIDHKTGRVHLEHAEQRSLYALGAFHMYPDVQSVHVEHWYLDSGEVAADDFDRKQVPQLLKDWEMRTRAMLNDKRFAPRPSQLCRYCHFRKDNGGPCQF